MFCWVLVNVLYKSSVWPQTSGSSLGEAEEGYPLPLNFIAAVKIDKIDHGNIIKLNWIPDSLTVPDERCSWKTHVSNIHGAVYRTWKQLEVKQILKPHLLNIY